MASKGDWCILRTAGRSTLSLAQTLAEDGYDVWTPARTQTIRKPRWNVKREVRLPLLPSFVFAKAHHLVDLLQLASMGVKPRRAWKNGYRRDVEEELPPHRDFSVFHYFDQIPLVSDRHLEALRRAEIEALPKKAQPTYQKGQGVRVRSGAFEGMIGKVEKCKSGHAVVIFSASHKPVKIPTSLLSESEVYGVHIAALKAA